MLAAKDDEGNSKFSIAYIANDLGVGEATVHRWMEDAGLNRDRARHAGAKPRAVREKALAMYANGLNDTAIAHELGVGKTSVRRWIEADGARRPARERALELWQAGKLATEIAVELSIPDYTVRTWADEAGLKRAPHHRPDIACKTSPEARARKKANRERKNAGLPPLKPPPSAYDESREKAIAMWIDGETDSDIAKALGVGRSTVHRWTKAAGAQRPDLGGNGRRWTKTALHRQRALELWQANIPVPEIERETGVKGCTVRYWAEKAGLDRPDQRWGPKSQRRGKLVASELDA
jgi:uncharacterized protein YjcR